MGLPRLEAACSFEVPDAPSTRLVICPSLQRLALGTYEEGLFVLDASLQLVHKLPGHPGGTLSVAWAGDQLLVSSGEDGHARIWDAASGAEVAALKCEGKDADRCAPCNAQNCL